MNPSQAYVQTGHWPAWPCQGDRGFGLSQKQSCTCLETFTGGNSGCGLQGPHGLSERVGRSHSWT